MHYAGLKFVPSIILKLNPYRIFRKPAMTTQADSGNKTGESDTAGAVQIRKIADMDDGQRIDNYLIKILKGVPKSRIYRAVRNGEVRINGSRVKADSRVRIGDRVRIPPIRTATPGGKRRGSSGHAWPIPVLYENSGLMVVDKPSGLAVHGGTGIESGLIEIIKEKMGPDSAIQLVHRIDRETSGCLMLAKSRSMLLKLHNDMTSTGRIRKQYLALVMGGPEADRVDIRLALGKKAGGGDHRIKPDEQGRHARTVVTVEERLDGASLVRIDLVTGRMHQARVHCAESGFPIAGDSRYGDRQFNRAMRALGLGRLFLHAHRLCLPGPDDRDMTVTAPLPESLETVLESLGSKGVE